MSDKFFGAVLTILAFAAFFVGVILLLSSCTDYDSSDHARYTPAKIPISAKQAHENAIKHTPDEKTLHEAAVMRCLDNIMKEILIISENGGRDYTFSEITLTETGLKKPNDARDVVFSLRSYGYDVAKHKCKSNKFHCYTVTW